MVGDMEATGSRHSQMKDETMVDARLTIAAAVWLAMAGYAHSIEECKGGHRAERHLSCVYDGDSGWHEGRKWRMIGVDAPELSGAACANERRLAERARDRLISLMSQGYRIRYTGKTDRYHRDLVSVVLPGNVNAGDVLVSESLAQLWPNSRTNHWCGR